jgi:nitrile hydratase
VRDAADASARFRPRDAVRVRMGTTERHIRTPWYVQGKVGTVERIHGAYRNPESLAYGGDGLPKQFLYLVGFEHATLWMRPASTRNRVLVDVYEHWLETA